MDDLPRGQADDRCEGRIRELDLRQLLDRHLGGHGRRGDLDDLDRLLTDDVGAQHPMRVWIHDELRETIRAPVDDRSIKVAVRDLADHDLAPAGARGGFGQADGPVLGIGEATVRHDRVVQLATPSPTAFSAAMRPS